MGDAGGVHPRRGRERRGAGEHLAVPVHHRAVRRIVVSDHLLDVRRADRVPGDPRRVRDRPSDRTESRRRAAGARERRVVVRRLAVRRHRLHHSVVLQRRRRLVPPVHPHRAPTGSPSPTRPRRRRCSERSRPASTRSSSTPCSWRSSSASSPPVSGAASS